MLEGTGCSCRLMSTHLVEVELELSLDVCCFVVVFVGGCFVVVSSRSSRRCFVECVLCRVGCDISWRKLSMSMWSCLEGLVQMVLVLVLMLSGRSNGSKIRKWNRFTTFSPSRGVRRGS